MADILTIKSKTACRFDLVALGEVMLRLDPGDSRIHTTRRFDVRLAGGQAIARIDGAASTVRILLTRAEDA